MLFSMISFSSDSKPTPLSFLFANVGLLDHLQMLDCSRDYFASSDVVLVQGSPSPGLALRCARDRATRWLTQGPNGKAIRKKERASGKASGTAIRKKQKITNNVEILTGEMQDDDDEV